MVYNYPYTDMYELNLDAVIKRLKEIDDATVGKMSEEIKKKINEIVSEEYLDRIIIPSDYETNITVEPELVSSNFHEGLYAQGMTSDGNVLYVAWVDNRDAVSNPLIDVFDLDGDYIRSVNMPVSGHYNNLNFYDGYLYATGFDNYTQMLKINMNLNSSTLIDLPEALWNVAIEDSYLDVPYLVGNRAYDHGYNIYSTIYGQNRFLPFTRNNFSWINGVVQGMCVKDAVVYAVTTPRGGQGTRHLIVSDLDGTLIKRVYLKGLDGKELEDCCIIDDYIYVNCAEGQIYRFDRNGLVSEAYMRQGSQHYWQNMCYIYINENGSEQYLTKGTVRLLKSFNLSSLAFKNAIASGKGYMRVDGVRFPIEINPNTSLLTVDGTWQRLNYTYTIHLEYNLVSQAHEYAYVLNESACYGSYRDIDGTLTAYSGADAVLQNSIFTDAYINSITAQPSIDYSYTGISL